MMMRHARKMVKQTQTMSSWPARGCAQTSITFDELRVEMGELQPVQILNITHTRSLKLLINQLIILLKEIAYESAFNEW